MKCLIVGGRASIADELDNIFSKHDYAVHRASRALAETNKKELSFTETPQAGIVFSNDAEIHQLDVVIFCIGRLVGKALDEYSYAEINDTFEANILLVIKILKKILPQVNDNASIVFLGSIAASAGSYDEIYSASKSALYGLTKSLAKKKNRGIRFNCVSPGLIEASHMYDSFSESEIATHIAQTPIKKLVKKSDLAELIFDICQPGWSSLNGQIINVNGGRYV